MAYLNVLAPSSIPVPSVRGLGAPRLVSPRGFGQAALTCAQYIAQQLASLPPAATAAMLLNTPTPSGAVLSSLYINGATSPQEAAQVVYQWAFEFCGQQADTVVFGGTPPADCSDNGQAAAAAAYPAALAYYSALPSSVWTTGTVSAQVANPQVFLQPVATGTFQTNDPAGGPPVVPLGIVSSSQTEGGITPTWQQPAPAPTPAPTPAPVPTPAQTTPVSTLQLPSFLSNDISVFGFDVPVWGLAAAAFAVVLLMPKGRG